MVTLSSHMTVLLLVLVLSFAHLFHALLLSPNGEVLSSNPMILGDTTVESLQVTTFVKTVSVGYTLNACLSDMAIVAEEVPFAGALRCVVPPGSWPLGELLVPQGLLPLIQISGSGVGVSIIQKVEAFHTFSKVVFKDVTIEQTDGFSNCFKVLSAGFLQFFNCDIQFPSVGSYPFWSMGAIEFYNCRVNSARYGVWNEKTLMVYDSEFTVRSHLTHSMGATFGLENSNVTVTATDAGIYEVLLLRGSHSHLSRSQVFNTGTGIVRILTDAGTIASLSTSCVDNCYYMFDTGASGYIYDNHVNSTSSPIVMYRSSTIELYSTSLYSDTSACVSMQNSTEYRNRLASFNCPTAEAYLP
eukprot:TRINITY_DN1577_c0_g1_i1.p1 TRINITY_DN1577_c0_g1~~TRINITY_DN1577_c0_g1_i1.p1  ORF type:complete len:357 (+),score=15.37 TRINITY_DN1577_c0_g1_i1:67-1137(+)